MLIHTIKRESQQDFYLSIGVKVYFFYQVIQCLFGILSGLVHGSQQVIAYSDETEQQFRFKMISDSRRN
jgi:hypothetical protein